VSRIHLASKMVATRAALILILRRIMKKSVEHRVGQLNRVDRGFPQFCVVVSIKTALHTLWDNLKKSNIFLCSSEFTNIGMSMRDTHHNTLIHQSPIPMSIIQINDIPMSIICIIDIGMSIIHSDYCYVLT